MQTIAPEEVGMSTERLARIRPFIQGQVEQGVIAGAITLVARRGKVAHFECTGQMDIEAGKEMQPDAIFRLYSMTKPIPCVAMMRLVEKGCVLLSDPLSKYIPAFKKVKVFAARAAAGDQLVDLEREITLRDLLMHTAGLGYGLFMDTPVEDLYRAEGLRKPAESGRATADGLQLPLAEVVQRLSALPLANQPGARWRYSMATDLLGYLIGLISDMPFDVFLSENIFKPLGMDDTGFQVPAEKLERFCACYAPAAGGLRLMDAPAQSRFMQQPRCVSGGGGLVSTASDYFRFAQMLLNWGELDGVRVLGRKTVQMMSTNQLPPTLLPMRVADFEIVGEGFGLGVSVRIDDASGKLGSTGMYGWPGAASTSFHIDPQEDMLYLYLPQLLSGPASNADTFQNLVYQAVVN